MNTTTAPAKSRRSRVQPAVSFYFSESSLRVAIEELQKAVKFRDLSLQPCTESVRRATRSIMRRAALNSRTSFAGGLIQAN